MIYQFFSKKIFESPISGQCSHFIAPENTRKPKAALRGYKIGTLARNGLLKLRRQM